MTCKVTVAGVEYDAPAEFRTRDGAAARVWETSRLGRLMGCIDDGEKSSVTTWCPNGTWLTSGGVGGGAGCAADLILPPSVAEQWDEAIKPVWQLFPWAKWVAKDEDGCVLVLAEPETPIPLDTLWHPRCGRKRILSDSSLNEIPIPWRESVRTRPEGV